MKRTVTLASVATTCLQQRAEVSNFLYVRSSQTLKDKSASVRPPGSQAGSPGTRVSLGVGYPDRKTVLRAQFYLPFTLPVVLD